MANDPLDEVRNGDSVDLANGGGERSGAAGGGEDRDIEAGLSVKQQMALWRLKEGESLVASATAAGVSRMTLHRWMKEDAAFAAAYNDWQAETMMLGRARLLAMSEDAVTAVGAALGKGDVKTALTVLKALGVMREPKAGE